MGDAIKVIKGSIPIKKYVLEELGVLEDEIKITIPTQEDLKKSVTLYLFVENIYGYKQFVPVDSKNLKEMVILTNKEEALAKCGA